MIALLLGLLLGVGPAPTYPPCPPGITCRQMPPECVTEDDPGPCWWDAPTRGNGQGRSFIVLPDGSVVYTDRWA